MSDTRTDSKPLYTGAVVIDVSGGNQVLTRGKGRGVYVGTGGNLACILHDGSAVTLVGLLVGHVYQLGLRQVTQTGTTITGHVLY